MVSRIGAIVAIADQKSSDMLDGLVDGSKTKFNNERIRDLCRALVKRSTPWLPTAKLISEEGRRNDPHFPSEQTIFNAYPKMLKIWKKAYYDIMNIDADPPLAAVDVGKIDTSLMSPSTGNIVDRLKAIVAELVQRNNGLIQIIDEGIALRSDEFPSDPKFDGTVTRLGAWLRSVTLQGFVLDEKSLKVGRKTPVGTRIMDGRLMRDLETLVEEYERFRATVRARRER